MLDVLVVKNSSPSNKTKENGLGSNVVKMFLLSGIVLLIFNSCYHGVSLNKSCGASVSEAYRMLGYEYHCESCLDPLSELDKLEERVYKESGNYNKNIKYNFFRSKINSDSFTLDEYKNLLRVLVETELYIKNYDVCQREFDGCNYETLMVQMRNQEAFCTAVLVKAKELEMVDRKRVLSGIFYKLCGNFEINKDNYFKVLEHLQAISFHHQYIDAINSEGQNIFDSLMLLDLHFMMCGAVNRLGCDLWNSVGGKSRVCQLGGHVISELFYDDDYHYFDADCTIGKPVNVNDNIPSLSQLKNGCLIDRNNFQPEFYLVDYYGDSYIKYDTYPSYYAYYNSFFYFYKKSYTTECQYYYKTASDEECINENYGWNYYSTVSADDVLLNDAPYFAPSIPYIEEILLDNDNRTVTIKWDCLDLDEDILCYKVFVSDVSRGWNWANYFASETCASYMVDLYFPNQWNSVGRIPDSAREYTVDNNQITIQLCGGGGIYL